MAKTKVVTATYTRNCSAVSEINRNIYRLATDMEALVAAGSPTFTKLAWTLDFLIPTTRVSTRSVVFESRGSPLE